MLIYVLLKPVIASHPPNSPMQGRQLICLRETEAQVHPQGHKYSDKNQATNARLIPKSAVLFNRMHFLYSGFSVICVIVRKKEHKQMNDLLLSSPRDYSRAYTKDNSKQWQVTIYGGLTSGPFDVLCLHCWGWQLSLCLYGLVKVHWKQMPHI